MGKRRTGQSVDSDYFDEPDYDKYSDEELDELYQYGEIRSARPRVKCTKIARPGVSARLDIDSLDDTSEAGLEDDWLDDDEVDDFFDD